jgi:5-methylcytosine-specific restriction endonuclease McrA
MRALLLNSTYQPISFISEKKCLKLFVKGKVEVLSTWDHNIRWGRGKMQAPAVVRLGYYVRWIPKKSRFNRLGVFRRDKNTCQYCGKVFKLADLTIDHVIPKSHGGKLNWKNSVTSCFVCNNKKGNRTPAEANMKLLKEPGVPNASLVNELSTMRKVHPDWEMYLGA